MWTISEVKRRGKEAFKANYWKGVLVALILLVCAGGVGAATSTSGNNVIRKETGSQNVVISQQDFMDYMHKALAEQGVEATDEEIMMMIGVVVLAVLGVIAVVILISSLIKILLLNPLSVGCYSYFYKSQSSVGSLDNLGDGFKRWGRNAGAMFLADLFIALWTCLFIIPGIVKSYSYRMVPYILADDPDCGAVEAITLSRKMMKGNKFKAFLLDLSFIGWIILSVITLGIVGVFYVNPYYQSADAALYEAIK